MNRRWRSVSPAMREAAQRLRRTPTPAETVLWEALRDRRLRGLRFRQQHPFETFVFDFCCPAANLIVEVDGGVHEAKRDDDAWRDEHLLRQGFETLRFQNEDVFDRLPDVLAKIAEAAFAINPKAVGERRSTRS